MYKYIWEGLEDCGFTESEYDECLFTNGIVMVLFWVDDTILYTKDKALIDKVILSLKDEYLLEREKDIAGFLGIKMTKNTQDGIVTL